MNNIEQLAHKIRFWEYQAGESFTDYFLDRCRFEEKWIEFLESKGYHDLVDEIKEDPYADQQLKFEVNHREHENEGGDWDEAIYFKDVLLWAEFILSHTMIMEECEEFFNDDYGSYFSDYQEGVPYGLS